MKETAVQEIDPRGEIHALQEQLNLAMLVAALIALTSLGVLIWKGRGKRQA